MGRAREVGQPTRTSCYWSWPDRTVAYVQLRLTRCSPTPAVNCAQAFQSRQADWDVASVWVQLKDGHCS